MAVSSIVGLETAGTPSHHLEAALLLEAAMSCLSRIPWLRAALVVATIASVAAVDVTPPRTLTRSGNVLVTDCPVLISPPLSESPLPPTIWTEGASGRTILLPQPKGMRLEFGICSPWRDQTGRFQVAGRLSGGPKNPWPGCAGLARVSFPDGEILDFVATTAIPTSSPCWFPGSRPRVLFAAGDGHLYQCAFDEAEGAEIPGTGGSMGSCRGAPTRIAWRSPLPLAADLFLLTPSWPRDSRFDHILLVVVRAVVVRGRAATLTGDQIWWIRLNEAGDAIVEAGPLVDPPSHLGGRYLLWPVAGKTADGSVALAYLSADRPAAGQWDLRTTRLSFDNRGRPRAAAKLDTKLAICCRTELPPTFSMDGRYVRILQAGEDGRGRLVHAVLPESGATLQEFGPAAIVAAGHLVASRVPGLISTYQVRSSVGSEERLR
jgi:hypothetical protein